MRIYSQTSKSRSVIVSVDSSHLVAGFVKSARRYGERPALFVRSRTISYRALAAAAGSIASTIRKYSFTPSKLAALLAYRSPTAYAGTLGILLAGRGFVPLNPRFPVGRTRRMLDRSKVDVLVVGAECLADLEGLLETEPSSLVILLPEIASEEIGDLAARFKRHRFLTRRHLEPSDGQIVVPREVMGNDVAYLLFTSGSTGDPKGVPVTHRNVRAYVDFAVDRYEIGCEDRISQAFDLTFDLSVHDMFTAWERGACLYCIPEPVASTAARFIRDKRLTHWFSVPSAASVMSRMRLLRPGLFPSLRYSLFCGEALPAKTLIAWRAAAPNSMIENLYGPTEATIAITAYRWDDADSRRRGRNGVVPIGWAFQGQQSRVVDENLKPVQPGQPGELLVRGSQITPGYWNNPEETRARYVTLGDGRTWYRTGDRVVEDDDGCLHYLGRLDDQVKIRGYRVELQEVDHVLREICDSDQVACIAWPIDSGIADGIVAFVSQPTNSSDDEIIRRCRASLPEHMVPRRIAFVADMPRNANGKIDRRKLRMQLEYPGNNE